MAAKYIGQTVDIHGGGIENIFPHHEDEIAQAEAASGQPFVRYWLHNNMVTVNGQKMGKSLGNFITLKDAFAGKPPLERPLRPMVLRYFILTSHYRSPLDFSVEALDAAEKGLQRLEGTVARVRRMLEKAPDGAPSDDLAVLVKETDEKFHAEMDSDFNTAGAIGALSTFTREVNRLLDAGEGVTRGGLQQVSDLYDTLGGDVLGIVTAATGTGGEAGIESELIQAMLDVRQKLREAKQYALADEIRAEAARGETVRPGRRNPRPACRARRGGQGRSTGQHVAVPVGRLRSISVWYETQLISVRRRNWPPSILPMARQMWYLWRQLVVQGILHQRCVYLVPAFAAILGRFAALFPVLRIGKVGFDPREEIAQAFLSRVRRSQTRE